MVDELAGAEGARTGLLGLMCHLAARPGHAELHQSTALRGASQKGYCFMQRRGSVSPRIPPIRSRRGPRRGHPAKFHADKDYDHGHLHRRYKRKVERFIAFVRTAAALKDTAHACCPRPGGWQTLQFDHGPPS